MTVHRTYDSDTATLLDLVSRKPQPIDLLTEVFGVSRTDIEGWVARLNEVGHDIEIDVCDIVSGR